jgi:hypothetical protein
MKVLVVHNTRGEIISCGVVTLPQAIPGAPDAVPSRIRVGMHPPPGHQMIEVEFEDRDLVEGRLPGDLPEKYRVTGKAKHRRLVRRSDP